MRQGTGTKRPGHDNDPVQAGNATPVARYRGEPGVGPAPGECCLRCINSTPILADVNERAPARHHTRADTRRCRAILGRLGPREALGLPTSITQEQRSAAARHLGMVGKALGLVERARMDLDAMRLLQDLPDDLAYRGWRWERSQSSVQKTLGSVRYVAVYARPFDRGIDDDQVAHHYKGTWLVRVSTSQALSQSWEQAYQQALELMREADALRQSPD